MWNASAYELLFEADAELLKITSQEKSLFQLKKSRCKLYQSIKNRFDFSYQVEDRLGLKTGRKHSFKVNKTIDVKVKNKNKTFQVVLNRTQLIGILLEESDCIKLTDLFRNLHVLISTNNKWLGCNKENVLIHSKPKESANRTPLSCLNSETALTNPHVSLPFSTVHGSVNMSIKLKSPVTPTASKFLEHSATFESNNLSDGDDFKTTAFGATKSSGVFYGSGKVKNKSYTRKFPVMQKKLFSDYSSSELKKSQIIIDEEHKEQTLVGFSNLGNTCYMNAILQCILNIPSFYQDLRNKQNIDLVEHKSLYSSLCNLGIIKHSSNSLQDQNYALKRVKSAISEATERFLGYAEHDAHEFLCKCLDQLKEEIGEKINTCSENERVLDTDICPIKLNFESQITHTVTCQECQENLSRTEAFNDFSLVFPEVDENSDPSDQNLKELIKNFFADEIVDYKCEKCSASTSILSHQFKQLPRILIFHIKRYHMYEEKKCDRVTLPKSLKIDFLISENTCEPYSFMYKNYDSQTQPISALSEKRKSVGILGSEPLNKSFKFSDTSMDKITGELLEQGAKEQKRKKETAESFTKLKSTYDKKNNFQMPKLNSPKLLIKEPKSFLSDSSHNDTEINNVTDILDNDLLFNDNNQMLSNLASEDCADEDNDFRKALELSMQEYEKTQKEDYTKLANENSEIDSTSKSDNIFNHTQLRKKPMSDQTFSPTQNSFTSGNKDIYKETQTQTNSTTESKNISKHLECQDNFINLEKNIASSIEVHNLKVNNEICKSSYTLVGVVNHHGSNISTGHYTSDSYDFRSNSWRSYNDLDVSDIKEHEVRFGRSQSAYIVFYMYNKCYEAISCA